METMKSTSLCVREDLVADSITLRQLASDLNDCISSPTMDISSEDAKAAYMFVISNKKRAPKNADGVRMLEEGDPIRPEVCRLLFHVPLSNLLRREERALNLDPVNSAIPAGREESPHAVPERKEVPPPAKRKSIGQSAAPVHTVEVYERPDRHAYDGYIGNTDVVSTIERQLDGAILRGDPLRPFLLRGASGVGKTELARRTARRLGRRLFRVTASVLKSGDDVHNLLATMSSGDVLLIDEAQELGAKAAAVFYDILSTGGYKVDGAVREILFLFATNLSAKLPDALKNRCIELRLKDYSVPELCQMVQMTAKDAEVSMDDDVAAYIAERSHSIARYAINYAKELITENAGKGNNITLAQAKAFFDLRGIDALGLKAEHRDYVRQLAALGQASVATLAAALGENDTSEVERATEPLLLKHGLITITSSGRTLTEAGKAYAQSA